MYFLTRFLSVFSASVLLFGFFLTGNLQAATTVAEPPIQVKALNDYLIYFLMAGAPLSVTPKNGIGTTMPP